MLGFTIIHSLLGLVIVRKKMRQKLESQDRKMNEKTLLAV